MKKYMSCVQSFYIVFKNFLNSFYRGKDCIKKFCKELKKIYIKVVNYEQKEMIPLTDQKKRILWRARKMPHMSKKVLQQQKRKEDLQIISKS